MLEPLIRANFSRLQGVYDRAPSPAYNFLTSARGWFLTRIRYSAESRTFLSELRGHEKWSVAEIAAYQLKALREIVQYARSTVPFYEKYPQVDVARVEDLQRLPVLARETVREDPERFVSRSIPPHQLIRAGTTGTTGANLKVAYTSQLERENWAFLLRQWSWAGIRPREPRVTFFGARVIPAHRTKPPFWTFNRPERQALASIFHLSEKTAGDYLQFLERNQGQVLEGFPSVLGMLADFALQCGRPIPMRVTFTSGEPLYADVRAKIESAFHARVFDSYGMTEYCGQIQECEHGRMHLIPEYGFLEILDKNHEPVGPDEEGDFVWTGLLNRAMPLIRYRIGDRGRWLAGPQCTCGRAFPQVVPTITRESDILRSVDGRLFSPRALNQLLKESVSLRFCQFVHDRPERVVVRAVGGNSNAAAEMMHIRSRLQELLGTSMKVTAELASAPVMRPGGKIPLIVNQVPR
jgi:phenylacetate-coenzyme A ligase PaaK-like adenylate-forming protein